MKFKGTVAAFADYVQYSPTPTFFLNYVENSRLKF
jgi:hypothetical protein